jgi:hypothetical protein
VLGADAATAPAELIPADVVVEPPMHGIELGTEASFGNQ